jgi:hypothetical protein
MINSMHFIAGLAVDIQDILTDDGMFFDNDVEILLTIHSAIAQTLSESSPSELLCTKEFSEGVVDHLIIDKVLDVDTSDVQAMFIAKSIASLITLKLRSYNASTFNI